MVINSRSIAISQLPRLDVANNNILIPIVFGQNNFAVTAGAVADLVTVERLGLENVANLAPLDFPVSTAQQDALDLKLNIDQDIPISQVIDLQDILDELATTDIQVERITGINDRIQEIIDSQPVSPTLVFQGNHAW